MRRSVMRRTDSISGTQAECFVTIGGNRYNFMSLTSFEATLKIDLVEVPVLGTIVKQFKPGKMEIDWKGTKHYNDSVMRELAKIYKDTGLMDGFEIQVTNEDPASGIGRQTIVLKDCLSSGGILAKFDESADNLDEEISGKANGFDMPEKFKYIEGLV